MKKHLRLATSELSYPDLSLGLRLQDYDVVQEAIRTIEKDFARLLFPSSITGVWVDSPPSVGESPTGTTSTWTVNGGSGVVWLKNQGVFSYQNHSFVGNNTGADYPKYYLKKTQTEGLVDKKARGHNIYSNNEIVITSPSVATSAGYTEMCELTGITTQSTLYKYIGTETLSVPSQTSDWIERYLNTSPNTWVDINIAYKAGRPAGSFKLAFCTVRLQGSTSNPSQVLFRAKGVTTETQYVGVYAAAGRTIWQSVFIPVSAAGFIQSYCYEDAVFDAGSGSLSVIYLL